MVQKIILVFKTHFDIGFTDLAQRVVRQYAGPMLRDVIETCRATEGLGPLRYVWTMPAWPLWYISEHCEPELRSEMERFIEKGQIVWHGLPFTSHTDFCAPEEYVQGFQYARRLSERYGKPCTVTGKMTDVPGHGLMLPDLLDQAGIRFLHLGCNEFATPPMVPPLFFWQGPGDGRVLTMYSKGGYGTGLLPPEDWPFPVWMALMHTHDNYGPQSAEIILRMAEKAREAYPEAEIVCGSMDDFYRELAKCDLSGLPVVDKDLADTWIHGVGSYPAEISQMRENRERARRLHRAHFTRWFQGEDLPSDSGPPWEQYYEAVCLFAEHTWGADVKTWLGPDRVYEKQDFLATRNTEPYRFMEQSWQEQRQRAEESTRLLDCMEKQLPPSIRQSPEPGRLTMRRDGTRTAVENHRYRLEFDGVSGQIGLVYDKLLSAPLLRSQDDRGVFSYQYDRYGLEDINEFLRAYGYHFTTWGIQDYGRENYPDCKHRRFSPVFTGYEINGGSILFHYQTKDSPDLYGDCRRLTLTVTLPAAGDTFDVELALEDKQATPFVESGSLIFPLAEEQAYRLGKPGAVIDPETQIVSCANHALLNLEHEITALGDDACLTVCAKDTPLVSIGAPGIYDYQKEFPRNRKNQLWFNLFNNMWGTNFPQWIEGNLRFRFTLWGGTAGQAADAPARAASVCLGTAEPMPGVPDDLSLVHTQQENGTLFILLRNYSGASVPRWIRMPGAVLREVDLLRRLRGDPRRDELEIAMRPYGLHCIALERG